MPVTTLMPLISSSFPPGSARAHAESIANDDARSIALAELAYFQGRAEDALALAAPYFESPDIGLRSSAYLISAYSCLPLSRIEQAREMLAMLERQAGATEREELAVARFARDAAFSLLHLDEGEQSAPMPARSPQARTPRAHVRFLGVTCRSRTSTRRPRRA